MKKKQRIWLKLTKQRIANTYLKFGITQFCLMICHYTLQGIEYCLKVELFRKVLIIPAVNCFNLNQLFTMECFLCIYIYIKQHSYIKSKFNFDFVLYFQWMNNLHQYNTATCY